MAIREVTLLIRELSIDRNWDVVDSVKLNHQWCMHSGEEYIAIYRLGLNKYIDEYKKLFPQNVNFEIEDWGFDSPKHLVKIDMLLLECIRKKIPEAKRYKFYSGVSFLEFEENKFTMHYPSEV